MLERTVEAINFDLLSVVLRNIHSAVVVVSSEVSHITMQCHSVIESTLIRFTTQIVSLTKEKRDKGSEKYASHANAIQLTRSMSCVRLGGRKSLGSRIKLGKNVALA